MSERGVPIVNDAPACPFVAFEDDREERASGPDQRHRCYAEVRPAPRAQAHQDAYCLSRNFAGCPTFQEWARREAARVREEAPPDARRVDLPPRRNATGGWSAPPPWSRGPGRPSAEPDDEPREFGGGTPRPEAGLAGSLAHRIALDGAPARHEPLATDADRAKGQPAGARSPRRAKATEDEWPLEREDSPETMSPDVARWARPEDRPTTGTEDDRSAEPPEPLHDEDERVRPVRRQPERAPTPGALARLASVLAGDRRPRVGDTRARQRSGEPAAPSWERPHHRYEAYPTLRTRFGVPALPRAGMLAIALLLAAVGLFFLPTLLGIGTPQGSPGPSASLGSSAAPSASAGPTTGAVPTPQTYEVQPGDTMSKIAAKFSVPLAALVEANKDKVPNPDRLPVGVVLVIPFPAPTGFPAAGQSAAPAATRAPSPR